MLVLALAVPTMADEMEKIGAQAYAYLTYIDANLSDRDCAGGANYKDAEEWIVSELEASGYAAEDIKVTDFSFTPGEGAEEVIAQNIAVTKKGTNGKQIIIGAHFDGTGTGDNGSGTALMLAAASAFYGTETDYNLTFVFFSAEEYGMWGSDAYAASMTAEEITSTAYMIDIDSIICGDYCYIYGGVANFEEKAVALTGAYDNARALADTLGLDVRSNPWTYENPEPTAQDGVPAYPSPSTGYWSDHVAFIDLGIPYLYLEATNWEIGDYDGYEETESFGPLMNTENDYLEKINDLFPGRAEEHLQTFATLLEALLSQDELSF
jgi:Zn-dependent M28 family amino/carboxypeptidase